MGILSSYCTLTSKSSLGFQPMTCPAEFSTSAWINSLDGVHSSPLFSPLLPLPPSSLFSFPFILLTMNTQGQWGSIMKKSFTFLRRERWKPWHLRKCARKDLAAERKMSPLIIILFQKWGVRSYPAVCKGLWEILGTREHEGPAEVETAIYDAPICTTGRPNMTGEGQ